MVVWEAFANVLMFMDCGRGPENDYRRLTQNVKSMYEVSVESQLYSNSDWWNEEITILRKICKKKYRKMSTVARKENNK